MDDTLPTVKRTVSALSWFCAAAGLWLAAMEAVQRHAGFEGRLALAVLIAAHSIATALLPGRKFLILSAGAVLTVGVSAIRNTLTGNHFEGYALVIGVACVAQAILTVATVGPPPHLPAGRSRRT